MANSNENLQQPLPVTPVDQHEITVAFILRFAKARAVSGRVPFGHGSSPSAAHLAQRLGVAFLDGSGLLELCDELLLGLLA